MRNTASCRPSDLLLQQSRSTARRSISLGIETASLGHTSLSTISTRHARSHDYTVTITDPFVNPVILRSSSSSASSGLATDLLLAILVLTLAFMGIATSACAASASATPPRGSLATA